MEEISAAHGLHLSESLINDAVDGSVDFKGRPVTHSRSGGWKSAYFIIGVEVAERFAYYGISSNLISYLTGPLGQSTAQAAVNVNVWSGVAALLPLLGAALADSFVGRYRMIIVASILYILGLGFLSLSAALFSFKTSDCKNASNRMACSPPLLQVILFFFSLYVVAFGQSGHKPCVQAFGADQFDVQDPKESKDRSSFFNWWYFSFCTGILVSLNVMNYIQDNLNWGLGFGIPCVVMCLALIVFLLGTVTYRFRIRDDDSNLFLSLGRVIGRARTDRSTAPVRVSKEEEARRILPHDGSQQFKFRDKSLITSGGLNEHGKVRSISNDDEVKAVLNLVPIWTTSLVYAIVFSQSSTLFTKQGATLDRRITSNFQIPAASLQSFIAVAIIICVPIYDRVLVPIARAVTRNPSGISMLQRIGTGIFLSILSMLIAAIVERKRLETVIEYGLIDLPNATVPMSFCWLIPQYLFFGVADVFTMIGLQEFFYDQVPNTLKSIGLSLYLSIFGVGSLLSSLLIYVIEKISSGNGQEGWFSDDMNRAHFDYFYWLLSGLSAGGFVSYVYFSKSYVYNGKFDV